MKSYKFTYSVFAALAAACVVPAHAQYTQQGNKLVGVGALSATAAQGSAVALSHDGNTAAVGGNAESAVWIFTRSGGVWTQQGSKLSVPGCTGTPQAFPPVVGCSVALSSDGNTLIVGARFDNAGVGSASVFVRNNGAWSQQGGKLVGSDSVGAAEQGYAVALSADGSTALVGGAVDGLGVGATWVYTRDGTGKWTQQGAKLVGTGGAGGSWQGNGVALSADGNVALTGAPFDAGNVGAAWVFTRNANGVWSQQGAKLVGSGATGFYGSYEGQSVALSSDGNTALIGGPNDGFYNGAAWVFTRSGSTWTQQGGKLVASDSGAFSYQGQSVSISGDGNTAAIGGPQDSAGTGAAWIYTRSGGVWTQQGSKLVGTGVGLGAPSQGQSVAISTDGSTVLVGGNGDSSGLGAAWAFVEPHFSIAAPASVVSGVGFTVTVAVLDAGNHSLSGYAGTVHISSSDGAAVLPADAALTAGTGIFAVTLKTTGNQTITATDKANAIVTGSSAAISVGTAAAAATHFSITAPITATVGTPILFLVTALDASNQLAAGYTGTVHFTSTDGAAVLSSNATLVNGSGTFSATLNTAGGQSITAADTVNASIAGTSNSITVSPVGATTPPAPVGVSPATGYVPGQSMFFTFTDARGTQDLGILNVLINNFLDGRNACYVAWDRTNGALYLVGDDGGTLLNVPASGTASNSQCTIGAAVVPFTPVANSQTVGLTIAFKAGFAGNKVIYMAARDVAQNNSGWQALGVVQVPGGTPATTTSVVGMTNARGNGLGPASYTFTFSDTKGFADLGVENILANNFIDGSHACYLAYSRPSNTMFLVNDSGTALSAGQSLAAAGSLNNSQCTVSWGAAAVSTTTNNLSLNLNILFTAGFGGNRVFYLAARDVNEANNTDWQALGSWTVQ